MRHGSCPRKRCMNSVRASLRAWAGNWNSDADRVSYRVRFFPYSVSKQRTEDVFSVNWRRLGEANGPWVSMDCPIAFNDWTHFFKCSCKLESRFICVQYASSTLRFVSALTNDISAPLSCEQCLPCSKFQRSNVSKGNSPDSHDLTGPQEGVCK